MLITLISSVRFLGACDPDAGKVKVAVCSACHGADGNSVVGLRPSWQDRMKSIFLNN